MTISGQVKQTVASLNGIQATLDAIISIEQNKKERQLLEQNRAKIESVIKNLEKRISKLEFEEPQYKGF
ncbi:DUF1657 domain-containing protein [Desulfotruncus alcoholivorax]|uniref:DUF1657 domain-containing protein n=1 Tax=Desulfotruncus alcoholivorax TaxID=265477 RepID=UPI0004142F3C|nr:DUF1657 domain-containing protein [Desulfotruncus alcoholivorax]